MFLSVYLFIRRNIPLYDQVFLYANRIKNAPRVNTPKNIKIISSPKMLSTRSPVSSLMARSNSLKKLCGSPKSSFNKQDISKSNFTNASGFKKAATEKEEEEKKKKKVEEDKFDFSSSVNEIEESENSTGQSINQVPSLRVNSNDLKWIKVQNTSKDTGFFAENYGEGVKQSNNKKLSQFYRDPDSPIEELDPLNVKQTTLAVPISEPSESQFILYCECGEVCEVGNTLCKNCKEKEKPIDYDGYLYINLQSETKKYWCRLLNKELYCYNEKGDIDLRKMFRLSGVFVKKENAPIQIEGVLAYPFSLVNQQHIKTFYCLSSENRGKWIELIQESLGYSSFFSLYEIKVYYFRYI